MLSVLFLSNNFLTDYLGVVAFHLLFLFLFLGDFFEFLLLVYILLLQFELLKTGALFTMLADDLLVALSELLLLSFVLRLGHSKLFRLRLVRWIDYFPLLLAFIYD